MSAQFYLAPSNDEASRTFFFESVDHDINASSTFPPAFYLRFGGLRIGSDDYGASLTITTLLWGYLLELVLVSIP